MVQPASTVTVRSAQACSMMRFNRAVDRTKSARVGGFPHGSLVPAPRGTTAIPASFAAANTLATSCSVPGSTTNSGTTPQMLSAGVAGRKCSRPTIAGICSCNVVAGLTLEERPASISEALRDSGGFEGMSYVLAGLFAAEAGAGKHFGGIRKLLRIESAANALHGCQVRLTEHFGHDFLFVF